MSKADVIEVEGTVLEKLQHRSFWMDCLSLNTVDMIQPELLFATENARQKSSRQRGV